MLFSLFCDDSGQGPQCHQESFPLSYFPGNFKEVLGKGSREGSLKRARGVKGCSEKKGEVLEQSLEG